MVWPTMSALSLLPFCRYYARADVPWPFEKTSPAAASGKKLHKLTEAMLNNVPIAHQGLNAEETQKWRHLQNWIYENAKPGWRPEVKLAWDPKTDTARILTAKGERNYADSRPGEICGSADVVDLATAHVIDFKTGAERDESAQLNCLSHSADLVTGLLGRADAVYVGTSGVHVTPYPRTAWASDTRELLSTVPFSQPTPGDHCDSLYCKARKVCPAYKNPKWKPAPFSLTQITSTPKEPQMSRLQNLKKGQYEAPLRIMLYGPEGVGKSTFAAAAPKPVWLGADSGTQHLAIDRLPSPATWQDVMDTVSELATEPHDYKTLVVDPINWLEPMLWKQVCQKHGVDSIELVLKGYGKGYLEALPLWTKFRDALEALSTRKQMNVILIAHSQVKKVSPPDAESYDRYTPAMNENASAIFRQWVDFLLFARIPVFTEKSGAFGKAKGRSTNQREIRTAWSVFYDSKSRPQILDPLPLDWNTFVQARKDASGKLDELKAQLAALLPQFPEETQLKAKAYLLEDPGSTTRYELTIETLHEKQSQQENPQS